MSDDYLTVDQAAARLQTSDEMVRRMLRDGRLSGFRLGGRRAGWRIVAASLAGLAGAEPPRRGRPTARALRPRQTLSPLDVSLERAHALAEAQWARKKGEVAEAERWEQRAQQIAAGIAQSAGVADV